MKCHNRGYGLIVECVWRGGAAFGWPTIRVQRAWKVAHDSVRMFGVSVAVDGVAMAQAAYRRWAGALWVRAQKRGSGEENRRWGHITRTRTQITQASGSHGPISAER